MMPEPVYYGGTVDRTRRPARTSPPASAPPAATPRPSPTAPPAATGWSSSPAPGDRIVIMGARDDTLSEFAAELLKRLAP